MARLEGVIGSLLRRFHEVWLADPDTEPERFPRPLMNGITGLSVILGLARRRQEVPTQTAGGSGGVRGTSTDDEDMLATRHQLANHGHAGEFAGYQQTA